MDEAASSVGGSQQTTPALTGPAQPQAAAEPAEPPPPAPEAQAPAIITPTSAATAAAAVATAEEQLRSEGIALAGLEAQDDQAKAERCAAARQKHTGKPIQGVAIQVLELLVEQAEEFYETTSKLKDQDPSELTSEKFYEMFILATIGADKNSYVELLESDQVGPPDYYISHAKGLTFYGLVDQVRDFASMQQPDKGTDNVFVWIDILCRDVSPKKKATESELLVETQAAIASCSGPTLLCLDGDGDALDLAWMQYEVWSTAFLKGAANISVLSSEILTFGHIVTMLSQARPESAKALSAGEKEAIAAELSSKPLDAERFGSVYSLFLLKAANAEAQSLAALQTDVVAPHLSGALHKCAVFAQACGLPAEAKALSAEASDMMKRSGLEDGEGLVAATVLGHGEALFYSKEFKKAEPEYVAGLEMQKKVLGDQHPDTMRAQRQLALTLKRQGKHKEAEKLFRELLLNYGEVYGLTSSNYATGLLQLAVVLAKDRQYIEAGKLAVKALEINSVKLGETDKVTLENLQLLKNLAKKQGDREAWDQYQGELRKRLNYE